MKNYNHLQTFKFVPVGPKRYVVSEDIKELLKKWVNGRDFKLPSESFFVDLRQKMEKKLGNIFGDEYCEIDFVYENNLKLMMDSLVWELFKRGISFDKVYMSNFPIMNKINISRLVDNNLKDIGLGSSLSEESIDEQFQKISEVATKQNLLLADDVIFSGEGIIEMIKKIETFGGKVTEIYAGVIIKKGFDAIRKVFPDINFTSYVFYEEVIDEVCERDFYAGVPFSGRLIGENDLPISPETGAPYFAPFGDAEKWASIPKDKVEDWSKFCLKQSIRLWEEIERVSDRPVYCNDLTRRPRLIPNDSSRIVYRLRDFL